MTPERLEEILRRTAEFYVDDHLVLTSELHTDGYVDCDPLFKPRHKRDFETLCWEIAERFRDWDSLDIVVGPETGGGLLATGTAEALGRMQQREIKAITAYKMRDTKPKAFYFTEVDRRYLLNSRALVLDDVLSTGSSLNPTIATLRKSGCFVKAVAFLVNRSELTPQKLGVPLLHSLLSYTFKTWTADECRLNGPCNRGKPINTKAGHGEAFVALHGQPKLP